MISCHALLLPFLASVGDVWVVDQGGTGQFTEIQPAIDAAADGDTILVRSGNYVDWTDFLIQAKGISLIAEQGHSVHLTGGVIVSNLAAGQTTLLSGLDVQPIAPVTEGLTLANNQGMVIAENCSFRGVAGFTGGSGTGTAGLSGAQIYNCAVISFASCSFLGGRGGDAAPGTSTFGGSGGAGLLCQNASVAAYDCRFDGAPGGDGTAIGGRGGRGVRLVVGTLLASNATFRGGDGGDAVSFGCAPGDGGEGLFLGSGTQASLLDCHFASSNPGYGVLCGNYGLPGADVSGPGTLVSLPGVSRTLQAPSPVRDNGILTLSSRGEPGDVVYLLSSFEPAFEWRPQWSGVSLAASPFRRLVLGTIPASGTMSVNLFLPESLVPSLQSRNLFLQCLHRDLNGSYVLSGAVSPVVLD